MLCGKVSENSSSCNDYPGSIAKSSVWMSYLTLNIGSRKLTLPCRSEGTPLFQNNFLHFISKSNFSLFMKAMTILILLILWPCLHPWQTFSRWSKKGECSSVYNKKTLNLIKNNLSGQYNHSSDLSTALVYKTQDISQELFYSRIQ